MLPAPAQRHAREVADAAASFGPADAGDASQHAAERPDSRDAERLRDAASVLSAANAAGAPPEALDALARRAFEAQPERAALEAVPESVAGAAQPGPLALDAAPRRWTGALGRALAAVDRAAGEGKRPIALFDLDDTLLDTSGRSRLILERFIAEPEILRRHPVLVRRIRHGLKTARWRFDIRDTARGFGVRHEAFLQRLERYWRNRFFRNEYIPEDGAVPGGAEFVAEILRRGGTVVYLTGRWKSRESGTLAGLRKHDLPLPDGRSVRLYMKPDKGPPDSVFKDAALPEIAALGEIVAGFENEPVNANVFLKHAPGAVIVFLDTRHSGRADPATGEPIVPAPGIERVKDYR